MNMGIIPSWLNSNYVVNTVLFPNETTYVKGIANIKHDTTNGIVVIELNKQKYTYNVKEENDLKKLIPTLLLSE